MKQTLLISLAAVSVLAGPLQSQQALSYKLGVSGGSSLPTQGSQTYNRPGFNAAVFLDVANPNAPVGVRLEAQHNMLGGKPGFKMSQITSGSVEMELNSDAASNGFSSFLIVGAGAYHIKTSFQPAPITVAYTCAVSSPCGPPPNPPAYGSVTKGGLNGGAGLRLPLHGLDTFVEARYHWISTRGSRDLTDAITFVPISFGVTF